MYYYTCHYNKQFTYLLIIMFCVENLYKISCCEQKNIGFSIIRNAICMFVFGYSDNLIYKT